MSPMPQPRFRAAASALLLVTAMMATPSQAWMIATEWAGKKACHLTSGPIEAPGGEPAVFIDLLFETVPTRTTTLRLEVYHSDHQFSAGTRYGVVIEDAADPDTLLFDDFLGNPHPYPTIELSLVETGNSPDSVVRAFTRAILGPSNGRMYISTPGGNRPHGPFIIDTSASRGLMSELGQCLQNL